MAKPLPLHLSRAERAYDQLPLTGFLNLTIKEITPNTSKAIPTPKNGKLNVRFPLGIALEVKLVSTNPSCCGSIYVFMKIFFP
jgi:hypothetical protein